MSHAIDRLPQTCCLEARGAITAVALALFCLPLLARAVPLSGIVIGDPCHKAVEAGLRGGFTAKVDREGSLAAHHGALLQRLEQGGEKVDAYIRCDAGGATVESISTTRLAMSEFSARAAYARDKAAMESTFGPATLDTEAMPIWRRIRFWSLEADTHAVSEHAIWTGAHGEIVSVELSQGRDRRNWRLYSLRARPIASSHLQGTGTSAKVPVDALLLVVTLAAAFAALAVTYAHTFRWPIVIASSSIMSYWLYWLPTWQSNNASSGVPAPDPSFPSLVAGLVTSLLISSWIVRALGHRLSSTTLRTPQYYKKARLLIQIACGLLITIELWVRWLFRPGQETNLTAGRLALALFVPLGMVLGIVLACLGTTRLLKAAQRTAHIARIDTGFVLAGFLIVVLSASSFIMGLLQAALP